MEADQTILQDGKVLAFDLGFNLTPRKMILHEENVIFCLDGAELIICFATSDIPIL